MNQINVIENKEDQMFRLFDEHKIKYKQEGSFIDLTMPMRLDVEVANAIRYAGYYIYRANLDIEFATRALVKLSVGIARV